MTRTTVESYADLAGDPSLSTRQRDRVLTELADGADAVVYLESWLVGEKDLPTLGGASQLVGGTIVAETEKAVLVTVTDDPDPDATAPGTDWAPKSQVRVYVAGENGVEEDTPQKGLTEF